MTDDICYINWYIAFSYYMIDRRDTQKRNKIQSFFVLRIKNVNREDRINTPGSLIVLQEN